MTKCNNHSVWPLAIWVIQVSDQSGRCPASKNAMKKTNPLTFQGLANAALIWYYIWEFLSLIWLLPGTFLFRFPAFLWDVIYEGTHTNLQMVCLYLYLSLFRSLSRRTTMHSDILLVLLDQVHLSDPMRDQLNGGTSWMGHQLTGGPVE